MSFDPPPQRTPTETLIDFYRRVNNPDPPGLAEQALASFEPLLARRDWAPENPYLGGYDAPIEVGVLVALLGDDDQAIRLLTKQAQRLEVGEHLDPDDLGELHAAALLRQLNLPARMLPPEKNVRTPDIVIGGPEPIDVEVVTGRTKVGTKEHTHAMDALNQVIPKREDRDVVVYLRSQLTLAIQTEIASAVEQLEPGAYAEKENLWRAVVTPPVGSEGTPSAMAARLGLEPHGWVGPKLFVTSVLMGGVPTQRVEVISSIPEEDYLNPVKRKAERPQRTGEYPYLVAFNVAQLPGAAALIPGLQLALSEWDHVSAVLMFHQFFACDGSKEWRALLVRNSASVHPLPPDVLSTLIEKFTTVRLEGLPAPH